MMHYRRFGRTELPMPVFSCGGMRYQQSWQDCDPGEISSEGQENLEACIHRALELGINHIETARGYGSSEFQLGRILPRLPREKLILQTKIGPAPESEFLQTFDLSMKNLQVEQIDLLGIHGINTPELLKATLKKGGALDAARKLQKDDRVRFVGFSTHGLCPLIEESINTGEFDYVNLHWYWINQSNEAALAAATHQDLGVFIISPNDKGGKLYAPPEKLRALCEPYSAMIFNDLFCLNRPDVHTLSVGAARPADFAEHLRALSFWDRRDELISATERQLKMTMEEELGSEWCRNWQEGVPSWDEVPGEINVWEILRLWNFARALDMVDFGRMRYNLLGNADHWFPGKNAAHLDLPALREALRGSPFADRILKILPEAHALLWEKPAERLSKSG